MVTRQGSTLEVFSSTLAIENSKFFDMSIAEPSIKVTGSAIDIKNFTVESLSSADNLSHPLILLSLESMLSINGINFTENSVPLISSVSSTLNLNELYISNVEAKGYPLNIDER